MKFIYCLNETVARDLESLGLKKIGETQINGQTAQIYENSKDVYLSKYTKNEIVLMNRLLFWIKDF